MWNDTMKKIILGLSILAGLFMASCSGAGGTDVKEIQGSWGIYRFDIDGVAQQLVISDINIEQKSKNSFEVHGNSGINSYFGEVSVSGKKLSVSDRMASTKMAGAPAEMEYEDNFLMCLTGAEKIELLEENGMKILKITNSGKKMSLWFSKHK